MAAFSGIFHFDGRPAVLEQDSPPNTPESRHEHYPLASDDGILWLVADARIDNRRDLFGDLSDGQTLLRAYREWGEDCAAKLLGDFAFAVWDKDRKTLFCARDHFGVRPFYYALSADRFIFSSGIEGVLGRPGVSRAVDENKIADYLLWSDEDRERTFYQDIKRLPPASFMALSHGKIEAKRYWSLDPGRTSALRSDDEYAETFRGHFFEAVRCRLRSVKPVGSLLSGGLDSSAVTVVARHFLAKEGRYLDTFSSVYADVPTSDEQAYIAPIARMPGIRSHTLAADRIAPFFDSRGLLSQLKQPSTHEISMFRGGIYPEAKRSGIGALLDGDGGDEVLCRGYLRLAELLSSGRLLEYCVTLTALSKNTGRSVPDLFISQSLRPLLPAALLRAWRFLRWGNRSLWFDKKLFNPAFRKRTGFAEREARQIASETTPLKTVKARHLQELTSGAVSDTFEVMDRAAAAFGIEHRYPFHDVRLAEFCLSLPSDQKLYRGWTKVVMRRALDDLLPKKIAWRGGKTYLSDEFVHRLGRFEKETLERLLLEDPSRLEPYYAIDALQKRVKIFLIRPSYEFAIIIWQAAMFSLWLEEFERGGQDHDVDPKKRPEQKAGL